MFRAKCPSSERKHAICDEGPFVREKHDISDEGPSSERNMQSLTKHPLSERNMQSLTKGPSSERNMQSVTKGLRQREKHAISDEGPFARNVRPRFLYQQYAPTLYIPICTF